jgi:hypothetical protein
LGVPGQQERTKQAQLKVSLDQSTLSLQKIPAHHMPGLTHATVASGTDQELQSMDVSHETQVTTTQQSLGWTSTQQHGCGTFMLMLTVWTATLLIQKKSVAHLQVPHTTVSP